MKGTDMRTVNLYESDYGTAHLVGDNKGPVFCDEGELNHWLESRVGQRPDRGQWVERVHPATIRILELEQKAADMDILSGYMDVDALVRMIKDWQEDQPKDPTDMKDHDFYRRF